MQTVTVAETEAVTEAEAVTVAETVTAVVIHALWKSWRDRLVSIWEAVWHLMFEARVLRFNNHTQRFEEILNAERHQIAEALMRTRMF
jgi:hypothetical protein